MNSPLLPHMHKKKKSIPIKTFVTSGGLGDVIMAVFGLHAFILASPESLKKSSSLYVKGILHPIASALLREISIKPAAGRPKRGATYNTFSNSSWLKTIKMLLTRSRWNNFPDRRNWFYGHPGFTFSGRILRMANDWILDRRLSWRREPPIYYGLKMWGPLAPAAGITDTDILSAMHRSFPILRQRAAEYIHAIPAEINSAKLAIFPLGKSFQYAPPAFIKKLVDSLDSANIDYACYFAHGDEKDMKSYEDIGLRCICVNSIDASLSIMAQAKVTVTVDSFAGHLAQIAAQNHVILISHDLPEHVVHPATPSLKIFEAMPCSPCLYRERAKDKVCAAGRTFCGAFSSDTYLNKATDAIHLFIQKREDFS
ncbi:glycosyltransferase family 9 protein [Uliginosibacterium flavum]|uniref:ADP-heptose:LPS heptosyltransferase n=1 Tax=Uliginosibacterium flavum TaxID=1396831 RepID=A0ABV2TH29_9RHOO